MSRELNRARVRGCVLMLLLAAVAGPAVATNAAYLPGYSPKSLAMGGGGTALPEDALTVHNNVAGYAVIPDQFTAAVTLYSPWTHVEVDGEDSRTELHWFPAPGVAWRRGLGADKALGLALYGNGGIGNRYRPSFLGGPGSGNPQPDELSISQISLLAVPSLAMRLNDRHAVGAGLLVVLQSFEAKGLALFGCFTPQGAADPACAGGLPSSTPDGLTDEGMGKSIGAGLRLGWLWQATDWLAVGAGASTPVKTTRMREYRNLLPDHGTLDQPGAVNLGLAWHVTPALTWTLDWQRTFYGSTKSYGNSGPALGAAPTADQLLGNANGFGFGFHNQDIYKVGLRYAWDSRLSLRAGFNYGPSPIDRDQLSFALLNPAIVERSVHFGFTWKLAGGDELTLSLFKGFRERLAGQSLLGPASVTHHEYALGFGYSWM